MGGVIFLVSIALMSLFMIIQQLWKFPFTWIAYDDPLVTSAGAGMLMMFSHLKIKTNRFINFCAASAFAVYLLHCNPFLFDTLFIPLEQFVNAKGGIFAILLSLIAIFGIAILLDQPRKNLSKYIFSKIFH